MENMQEDLKAHLMATDAEFRKLAELHADYHGQLEALEAASNGHLTQQEQIEEHRLKKLKLHAKDQMNAILRQYKAQHVG